MNIINDYDKEFEKKISNEFGIKVKIKSKMSPEDKYSYEKELYNSLLILCRKMSLGKLVNPSGKLKIIFDVPDFEGLHGMYYSHNDKLILYSPDYSSLAHELFHAIDYQAGRMFGIRKNEMLSDYLFIAERYMNGTEKEVASDMCEYVTGLPLEDVQMIFAGMMKRSKSYDMHIGKRRYESLPKEILARGFEAYISYKLTDEMLLYSRKQIEWMRDSSLFAENYFYPTREEVPLLSAFYENAIECMKSMNIRERCTEFDDIIKNINRTYMKNKDPLFLEGTKMENRER